MKGIWHIVDAVLASVVLVGFLLMASRAVLVTPEDFNLNSLPNTILRGLDDRGVLRQHAVDMDASAIEAEITQFTYDYAVQVCNATNSCNGTVPSAKNVWVGKYFVAGNSVYSPRVVKLFVWRRQ